jgi:hypothetical protein
MTAILHPGQKAFALLRQYAHPPRTENACALCGAKVSERRRHLVEPGNRRIVCACRTCALLFANHRNGRYRLIPEQVHYLEDFQLSDAQWDGFYLPINLAFFFVSSPMEHVVAMSPSPVGAIESLLPLEDWQDLEKDNPVLGAFEPDVEALLVNRVGPARDHYRVPIDECYKLVGILRAGWRDLADDNELEQAISEFFEELNIRVSGIGAVREF